MVNQSDPISFIGIGNLEAYIRMAKSISILTAEKEKYLAYRYFDHGDLESAKLLILSHLRFVIHISKNYLGYGLPKADLIQEGNIGLMKSIRRFNPNMEVRLISFAVYWIKSEIHEYVLKNWRIVRIATTKAQRKLFFNLRRTKKRLGWFNQIELENVAQELGVTSKDVKEMESRMMTQDIEYNYLPNDSKSIYLNKNFNSSSYLEDKKSNFANVIESNNWNIYNSKKINHALLYLDKRSQQIIKRRWLNKNHSKITLRSIAKEFGISAERVRQLEKNAMKKLKLVIKS